jgi:hypothetical protein
MLVDHVELDVEVAAPDAENKKGFGTLVHVSPRRRGVLAGGDCLFADHSKRPQDQRGRASNQLWADM